MSSGLSTAAILKELGIKDPEAALAAAREACKEPVVVQEAQKAPVVTESVSETPTPSEAAPGLE